MRTMTLMMALLLAAPATAQDATAPDTPAMDRDDLRELREAVRAGRIVPLQRIIDDALRRVPGTVVEVDLDLDDDEYEIEILAADGRVHELEYRASSGELLSMEEDD